MKQLKWIAFMNLSIFEKYGNLNITTNLLSNL